MRRVFDIPPPHRQRRARAAPTGRTEPAEPARAVGAPGDRATDVGPAYRRPGAPGAAGRTHCDRRAGARLARRQRAPERAGL